MNDGDDIRRLLVQIDANVARMRRLVDQDWTEYLLSGLLRGAGFVAGTVAAVALLSWILTLVGVLPGFDAWADYLRGIVEAQGA